MTHQRAALPPFHLAIPVDDLAAAEAFYSGLIGCPKGRRSDRWIDFDFFGHQLVVHLVAPTPGVHVAGTEAHSPVDGEDVPVRHFGAVLDAAAWEAITARLVAAGEAGEIDVVIPPTLRHEGHPGEQRIMFVRDPAGNALEFKTMTHPDDLFAA